MKNVLKKVFLFCLTFVLLLSSTMLLTACGDSGSGSNPGKNPGGSSGGSSGGNPSVFAKNDDLKEFYEIAKDVINTFSIDYSGESNAANKMGQFTIAPNSSSLTGFSQEYNSNQESTSNSVNFPTIAAKVTSTINKDQAKIDVTDNAGNSIRVVFENTLIAVLACGDVLTNNYGYTTLFGVNATIRNSYDYTREQAYYSITKEESENSATYSLYLYTESEDEEFTNYANLNMTINKDESFNLDYVFFDNNNSKVQFAYADSESHFLYLNNAGSNGSAMFYNGFSAYESQTRSCIDACQQIIVDSLDFDAVKDKNISIKDEQCEEILYREFSDAVEYYVKNLLVSQNGTIGSIFTIQDGCLLNINAGDDFDQRVLTIPNGVTSICLNSLNIPSSVYTMIIPESVTELKVWDVDDSNPDTNILKSLTLETADIWIHIDDKTAKCNIFQAYDRSTQSWHNVDIAISENSPVLKEVDGNRYVKIEGEWYLYAINNPDQFSNIQPDWHIDYKEFKIQMENFVNEPDDYVKPAGSLHQTQTEVLDKCYPKLLPAIRRYYQTHPLPFAHFNNVVIDIDATNDPMHELDVLWLDDIANFETINTLTLNITYGNQEQPSFSLVSGKIKEIGNLVVNQDSGVLNVGLYERSLNGKYYGLGTIHNMQFSEGIEALYVTCQTDTDVINVPNSINSLDRNVNREGLCDFGEVYALKDLTINYNYSKVGYGAVYSEDGGKEERLSVPRMADGKTLTITTKLNRFYNLLVTGDQSYAHWEPTWVNRVYEELSSLENINLIMQSPIWYTNFDALDMQKEDEIYKYFTTVESNITEIDFYNFTDWTNVLDSNNNPTGETNRIVVYKDQMKLLDYNMNLENLSPDDWKLPLVEGHNIFTLSAINDYGKVSYTIDIYRKTLYKLIFNKNCDEDLIGEGGESGGKYDVSESEGYSEDDTDFSIYFPFTNDNARFAYYVEDFYIDADCTIKFSEEYADIIQSVGRNSKGCITSIRFKKLTSTVEVYAKWVKKTFALNYVTYTKNYGYSGSSYYTFDRVTIPENAQTQFDIDSEFNLVTDVTPSDLAECYTFKGWSTRTKTENNITVPDKSYIITSINRAIIEELYTYYIYLYPVFEVADFDFAVDYCGGVNSSGDKQKVYSVTLANYDDLILERPTKVGYNFNGWYYYENDPDTNEETKVCYQGRFGYPDKLNNNFPIEKVRTLYAEYLVIELNVNAYYKTDLSSDSYKLWNRLSSYENKFTIENEFDLISSLETLKNNNELANKIPLGYQLDYLTLDPNELDPETGKPIPVTKLDAGYTSDASVYMVYKKIQFTVNIETIPCYSNKYNSGDSEYVGYYGEITEAKKSYTFTYDIDMVGLKIDEISAPTETQIYNTSGSFSVDMDVSLIRITDENWHKYGTFTVTNGVYSYTDSYPTYPMPYYNTQPIVSGKYPITYVAFYTFQIKYFFEDEELNLATDIVCTDESLPTLPSLYYYDYTIDYTKYKAEKVDWVFDYWYYIDEIHHSKEYKIRLDGKSLPYDFDREDGIIKIRAEMHAPIWLHVSKEDVKEVVKDDDKNTYETETETEFISAIRFNISYIGAHTRTNDEDDYILNAGSSENYGLVWYKDANRTEIYQTDAGENINSEDETRGKSPMHLYGKFYPLARFILNNEYAYFQGSKNTHKMYTGRDITIDGIDMEYIDVKIMPDSNTLPKLKGDNRFTIVRAVAEGWYTDVNLTKQYTNDTLPNEPITLYAKTTQAITFKIDANILKFLPFNKTNVDSWFLEEHNKYYFWSYIIYTGATFDAPSVTLKDDYLINKGWYTKCNVTIQNSDGTEKTETQYAYSNAGEEIKIWYQEIGELVEFDYDITVTVIIDKTYCESCTIYDTSGKVLDKYKNYVDLSTDTQYIFRFRKATWTTITILNYFPKYVLKDGYKADCCYEIDKYTGVKSEYGSDDKADLWYTSKVFYLQVKSTTTA